MQWFALHVESGKEEAVKSLISKKYNESVVYALVPKRNLYERRHGQTFEVCKIMFPGYVLFKTEMNVKTYYELGGLPNSYRLLKNNKFYSTEYGSDYERDSNLCSRIEDAEMELLLQLMGTDGIIGFSTLSYKNSHIVVFAGPLKGKEKQIQKIDTRHSRARISFRFDGNERAMDVGIKVLT